MRVFIAGATGVLGRRLVEECTDRGHEVVGLTRGEAGDTLVRERGGQPHRGDLFDYDSLVDGVTDADVVVHVATKVPTDTNPDDESWRLNDRVRREGATNLVTAAASTDADRFVQQSVVWVARQPDGSFFDATAAPNPDRSTRSALDAERTVERGASDHGFEAVVLRGGWFYGADTAHTRLLGEGLLAGRLPLIGGGLLGRRDATLSFVHVDDAGRAFADAVEGEVTGTYHVVDDEPTTYARFLQGLADRLGASRPRRVPGWLARLFVDENLVRLLTCSMPTTNERFSTAFDWTPEYPTVDEGLDQIIARWKEEETASDLKYNSETT